MRGTLTDIYRANDVEPSVQEVSLVEQELLSYLQRKKELDKALVELECQLYLYETSFLEKYASTSGGNILKGLDPIIFIQNCTNNVMAAANSGRSVAVKDEDRLFSNSSYTTQKEKIMNGKFPQSAGHYSDNTGSAHPLSLKLKSSRSISSIGKSLKHKSSLHKKSLLSRGYKKGILSHKKSVINDDETEEYDDEEEEEEEEEEGNVEGEDDTLVEEDSALDKRHKKRSPISIKKGRNAITAEPAARTRSRLV